jgi:hypothetical protein
MVPGYAVDKMASMSAIDRMVSMYIYVEYSFFFNLYCKN